MRRATVHHISEHHKAADPDRLLMGYTLEAWENQFMIARNNDWGKRFSSRHWFPLTKQGQAECMRFISRYGLDEPDDFEYGFVKAHVLQQKYPHAIIPIKAERVIVCRLNPHKYPGA